MLCPSGCPSVLEISITNPFTTSCEKEDFLGVEFISLPLQLLEQQQERKSVDEGEGRALEVRRQICILFWLRLKTLACDAQCVIDWNTGSHRDSSFPSQGLQKLGNSTVLKRCSLFVIFLFILLSPQASCWEPQPSQWCLSLPFRKQQSRSWSNNL